MALLDWIVIGVFCCALIGIVVWVVSQKNDNSADYFLGDPDSGLGLRTFLHPFHGVYDA